MMATSTDDPSQDLSYLTVFVQNVPTSCTREQFHEVFSVIGPIRQAFVNKPKNLDDYIKDNKSLVGFVTYVSREDAEKAAKSRPGTFVIDKKRLKVRFARKKISEKKKRKKLQATETSAALPKKQNAADIIADFGFEIVPIATPGKQEEDSSDDEEENEQFESDTTHTENTAPTETHKVLISGFPDSYTIKNFVELWNQRKFDVPEQFSIEPKEEGCCRRAVVEMGRKQAALRVLTHLNGIVLGGETVKATLVLDPKSKYYEKTIKQSRMIVRNLSFGIKEKQLREAFEKYGTITEIKIPLKPNGKKTGYAFVQLSHKFESLRAVKEVNMTQIGGRKVSVDLCLPRENYKKMVELENRKKMEEEPMDEDEDFDSEENDNGNESESDRDDASDIEMEETSSVDERDSDEEPSSNTDESDSDRSEDDSEASEDEKKAKSKKKKAKKLDAKKAKPSDVEEGRTVFLRNLSFDATEENLKEEMKKFGTFKYCLVVMNPETGFSKGTAFVQFNTKEMADECVKTLQDDKTQLVIQDRRIMATIAQSREGLKKHLKEKQNEEKEDKNTRNLYLSNEGIVRPGTLASEGVSEVEMKKRTRIEMMKRAKLKDPNVIVSTTRLCVHNVPRSVDDQKLKQICRDALKGVKDALITECRVMRDREHANEEGVGRSLGYAFVKYSKHEHALFALRTLNNNPEIFGAEKRPIVEFSLEDKRVLQIKEQRRQKQLTKNKEQRKRKMEEEELEALKPPPNRKAVRVEKLRADRKNKRLLHSSFKETAKAIEKTGQEKPSFMGSSCLTSSGKKTPVSKHIGPKIRKRNKTQVMERLKESKKLNKPKKKWEQPPRKRQISQVHEPRISYKTYQKQRKLSKRQGIKPSKQNADFDKLVAKYTQKFKANKGSAEAPRLKWFDN